MPQRVAQAQLGSGAQKANNKALKTSKRALSHVKLQLSLAIGCLSQVVSRVDPCRVRGLHARAQQEQKYIVTKNQHWKKCCRSALVVSGAAAGSLVGAFRELVWPRALEAPALVHRTDGCSDRRLAQQRLHQVVGRLNRRCQSGAASQDRCFACAPAWLFYCEFLPKSQ